MVIMRFITGFAVAAGLAATAAVAAPPHLSDAQFIAANRCLGLMSSKSLGVADAAALKQLLKDQDGGRGSYIDDKADEARQDAQRQASSGSEDMHAKLLAERDGLCRTFVNTATASQPPASPKS
jgi:hypothetical protein